MKSTFILGLFCHGLKPRLRFFYYYKLSPVRHAKFSISTDNIVESGPRPTPSKCLNKFPWIPSCNRVIPGNQHRFGGSRFGFVSVS